MKKIISLILALVLCLSFAAPCFAEEVQKSYVVLGDSISQGFGVENPGEASYAAIIANTNNYSYTNLGKAAKTSTQLLDEILNDEKTRESIKSADLMSMSIGGNDYFCDSRVVGIALGAILNIDTTNTLEITKQLKENYLAMLKEIRALNPNAVILLQYVPVSWFGLLGTAYERVTSRINKVIDEAAAAYPDNLYIVDVASAMAGHKDYIAEDALHPNSEGNVAIAKAFQAKLVEIGLADSTEVKITAEGIEPNFYVKAYGKVLGKVFWFLVNLFTGNL